MDSRKRMTADMYRAFANGDDADDVLPGIGETAIGGRVVTVVSEKADLRRKATGFDTEASGEPEVEGVDADELWIPGVDGDSDRVYVRSYPIDGDAEKASDEPTSVHAMYVDDETGIPVCSCPEIAEGGVICHHMVVHAKEEGYADG